MPARIAIFSPAVSARGRFQLLARLDARVSAGFTWGTEFSAWLIPGGYVGHLEQGLGLVLEGGSPAGRGRMRGEIAVTAELLPNWATWGVRAAVSWAFDPGAPPR